MNKTKIIEFLNKYFYIIVGIIIGIATFLIVYGTSTLDVTYDDWILNDYIEDDIVQHYAGWVNFRNSDWTFPLGKTTNLANPDGIMISFTDSIPLFSIFFKLFRNVLPEIFQFFGIYTLLCFALQGIASALLISCFTKNKKYIAIGTVLFTLSPILLERAFRHTALASQWLILFALYLYFKSRKEEYKFKWQYFLLTALAITIHPYFIPMVCGIMFANVLEIIIHKKCYVKGIAFILANMILAVLIGYVIGTFGTGTSFSDATEYGYFSMNLNSIINPKSYGIDSWSAFLKTRPQTLGNYDGFNYLGFGSIIIGIFILLYQIISNGFKNSMKKIGGYIKNNLGLFLVLVVFLIFAISNVVTLDDQVIFKYPLPKIILRICAIFRASSRMFYPVFYMIFVAELVYIFRTFKAKNALILLIVFLVIQIIDLRPTLYDKNQIFANEKDNIMFDEPIWQTLSEKIDKMYVYPNAFYINRHLAVFAGENDIISNINISTKKRDDCTFEKDELRVYNELLKGNNPLDEKTVFITDILVDQRVFNQLKENLNSEITIKESLNYKIFILKSVVGE